MIPTKSVAKFATKQTLGLYVKNVLSDHVYKDNGREKLTHIHVNTKDKRFEASNGWLLVTLSFPEGFNPQITGYYHPNTFLLSKKMVDSFAQYPNANLQMDNGKPTTVSLIEDKDQVFFLEEPSQVLATEELYEKLEYPDINWVISTTRTKTNTRLHLDETARNMFYAFYKANLGDDACLHFNVEDNAVKITLVAPIDGLYPKAFVKGIANPSIYFCRKFFGSFIKQGHPCIVEVVEEGKLNLIKDKKTNQLIGVAKSGNATIPSEQIQALIDDDYSPSQIEIVLSTDGIKLEDDGANPVCRDFILSVNLFGSVVSNVNTLELGTSNTSALLFSNGSNLMGAIMGRRK